MTKEQTKCPYCHNKFEDMVDLSEFDGSLTMEKYHGQLRLSGYSFPEMGTNAKFFILSQLIIAQCVDGG